MAVNEYRFLDRWRVEGTVREVADIIGDPASYARWWPAFVRTGERLEPGETHGVGEVYAWRLKGWLPYTVRLTTRTTESRYPHGFTLEARGDLNGRGVWRFEQDGDFADISYDWRVRADRPLLRYGSWLLKPLFASNHRWAMARGEESLRLELERRRLRTPEERSSVPRPPGPAPTPSTLLALGAALAAVAVGALIAAR